jgi:Ribonuclease G/E
MANTKSITDKSERKKLKRAARKKTPPKGPRTGARGENKAKIKKASRGQAKR